MICFATAVELRYNEQHYNKQSTIMNTTLGFPTVIMQSMLLVYYNEQPLYQTTLQGPMMLIAMVHFGI